MQTIIAPSGVFFKGAYPIGDTNVRAVPVKELAPAIAYYTRVLNFTLVSQTETAAVLRRDEAEIGVEENDADPEQASVYFAVSGLDALRQELEAAGMKLSPVRIDEHAGEQRRIFFAREPYGVCFCFGEPVEEA